MMTVKRIFCLVLTMLLVSCAKYTTQADSSALYMLSASSAKFQPISKTQRQYTLTLYHVNPDVQWLNDRPSRMGGSMSFQDLVKVLQKAHHSSIYQSATLHSVSQESATILTFTLHKSIYDEAHQKVTYVITLMQGSDQPSTHCLEHVRLFIGKVGM